MYAADGISGSASVRLLRLVRQACAVQNTSNCMQYSDCCTCSILKVHAHQRTQDVFFRSLVETIDILDYIV